MNEQDFPALYRSADDMSLRSQKRFLFALKVHLFTLILTAALSIINNPHWTIASLQLVALLVALASSVYLFLMEPEKQWYSGRAVAESIKTITWRYVCRAEPFQGEDHLARNDFKNRIGEIIKQNRDISKLLTKFLDGNQITPVMQEIRNKTLEERRLIYLNERITDQLTWYAKKASANRNKSRNFFASLIAVNFIAVIFAILRIKFTDVSYWPTDIIVAVAASLLSWMQTKRFSELASSYALAAHEISLMREQVNLQDNDMKFSVFVGDAENAFSREHTQWVARKDI
jgi:hypothetical protein